MTSTDPLLVRLVSSADRTGLVFDEVRPASEADGAPAIDDDPHARAMVEMARQVLLSETGLSAEKVVASRWIRQTLRYAPDFHARYAWHFDYGQHSGGVFSAIIYTGHDDADSLVGGETAFADTPPPDADGSAAEPPGLERLANGTAALRRGLIVAPRVGRLVLFSGGSENYHAPMPVYQGRRQSLQVWFSCACSQS